MLVLGFHSDTPFISICMSIPLMHLSAHPTLGLGLQQTTLVQANSCQCALRCIVSRGLPSNSQVDQGQGDLD